MLQKNAITEVPPSSPGFYSNVFLVRKASGGWRPVIDLKSLNVHIWAPHFRMYTTGSVLSTVPKEDYAFKIDLQNAYFHVPIHPSSRKYLRFAFENKVYQFRVLPFSLNKAPQVFTRLGHTVSGYLHRLWISVVPYLDEWLIHHPDQQVRPLGPCQLTSAMAGPIFSYLWNPYPSFQADITIFTDASTQGWGAHMGDSQISGSWAPLECQLHINYLGFEAVEAALRHWAQVLQGCQVMIATDNSTVVSYINKQGGTRSRTLLRLVVELFMWLQAQNIVVRARHIPGCLNVIADHLSPSRNRES